MSYTPEQLDGIKKAEAQLAEDNELNLRAKFEEIKNSEDISYYLFKELRTAKLHIESLERLIHALHQ
ncbi:hypothetical protein ACRN94_16135 [Shewanella baltica]|uniref:hypothetical protein n=1 Tax=Shewanella baltica TaxID=62322 RepID=UPI003D7A8EBD